jgi:rubrerythrin
VGGPLPAFAGQGVDLVETAPEWKAAEHLGLDEALHLALSCENQAACYYAALAERFEEPMASFFESVARSELEHAHMIEAVLSNRVASGLSSFTLAQVVRNMIEAERASARFYKAMAGRARNARVRAFFLGMVDVEELHAGQIESSGLSLVIETVPDVANIPIDTVETLPSWTPNFDGDLEGALAIALECESRAARFYRMVASYLQDEHAAFVREMADTEDDHARSIADLLRALRAE